MRLEGKSVVITGSGSGVGRASALLFAREGAKVVCADVMEDWAKETVRLVEAEGNTAIVAACDVTKEPEVLALFEKTLAAWGKVNILVNNAGMATRTPTWQMTLEMWQSVVDLNLTAAFLCSREAFRCLDCAAEAADDTAGVRRSPLTSLPFTNTVAAP